MDYFDRFLNRERHVKVILCLEDSTKKDLKTLFDLISSTNEIPKTENNTTFYQKIPSIEKKEGHKILIFVDEYSELCWIRTSFPFEPWLGSYKIVDAKTLISGMKNFTVSETEILNLIT